MLTSKTPVQLHSHHMKKIAVIGAGAAGLAAARELKREGHDVIVYERNDQVGGIWAYTPSVDSDPLGSDPARNVVHSSMYRSLRTNLPRESMGFLDYPFGVSEKGDERRYPGHEDVLRYLEDFAREFGVCGMVRLGTEVVRVEKEKDGERWVVRFRNVEEGNGIEVFDAVVVCNGHYTEPKLAEFPGVESWPGKQMHSHNFRVPEPFLNQVVIIIGSSFSAFDISRDIARLAKEVHIANRSPNDINLPLKVAGYDNLWLHSMIERAEENGSVIFPDGASMPADVIIHCTGYKYHFPFLETNGIVSVDENRVGPLYKHVFPPKLSPSLSFIGIPFKVLPFMLAELQSKWVARVLSGRIKLPTEEEMIDDVNAEYANLDLKGWPKKDTHKSPDFQFEYDDWLAEQSGLPPVEQWRKEMFLASVMRYISRPETYRDEFDDDYLVEQAYQHFAKYL